MLNVAEDLSYAHHSAQGKDFELIIMVKMETRHSVVGPFGSEFPGICNICLVMTACSHKTWKFCEQFLRFLQKRPLMEKFSKFYSESLHGDTD